MFLLVLKNKLKKATFKFTCFLIRYLAGGQKKEIKTGKDLQKSTIIGNCNKTGGYYFIILLGLLSHDKK